MKKNTLSIIALATLLTPQVAFAAKDLSYLMNLLVRYIQAGIYLIIALATITFIWGIWKYFFMTDSDKKEALQYVLYGTVGFFVMLSFWGLVAILRNTLKLEDSQPNIPSLRFFGSSNSNASRNSTIDINATFEAGNFNFDSGSGQNNSGTNNGASGVNMGNPGASGVNMGNPGDSGININNPVESGLNMSN